MSIEILLQNLIASINRLAEVLENPPQPVNKIIKMFDEREAAKYLQCSVAKLQRDRSTHGNKLIPFIKIGHQIKYREDDLQKYIESCKH